MKEQLTNQTPMDNNKAQAQTIDQIHDKASPEFGTTATSNPNGIPTLQHPNNPTPIMSDGTLIRLNEFYSYHPGLNTIGLTSRLIGVDVEVLERQVQAFADQNNAEGWTVFHDYSATGEGRHIYYLRSHASSEAAARADFKARFFNDANDRLWEWVLIGLEVYSGTFWPDYLVEYRMPPDELEMHWHSRL